GPRPRAVLDGGLAVLWYHRRGARSIPSVASAPSRAGVRMRAAAHWTHSSRATRSRAWPALVRRRAAQLRRESPPVSRRSLGARLLDGARCAATPDVPRAV